jgi:chemotaxis protein MotB
MSKKKAPESEGNSERWLLSYSDFMTLLMTMFVILYSMGQVDVQKYKQLADSFKAAFSVGGPVKVVDAKIDQSGGSDANGQPNPIEIPGIPQKPPDSEEVAGQLTSFLSSQNLGKEVSVQTNIEGVLISLSEELVFPPGTATLQPDAYPVLDTIITMLKKIENPIRIVGHTDNTPPVDSKYKSNWDLSLARAMVIGDYLIKNGIQPDRLTVSGRGEYDPVFPNDTPEHKALNSRADIVIIYQVDSNVAGLDSNHLDSAASSAANTGGTQ